MDARVAVVIITRDRVNDLMRTLRHLRALPERPAVIVVDNGSRDGTPDRVAGAFEAATVVGAGRAGAPVGASAGTVTVLRQDRDLGAAGRTAGVLATGAPYVAFCDDDSWWEPGSLGRAADLLAAHPDVGLVAGRVMLAGGRLEPACAEMAASRLRGRPGLPGPPVRGFVACGAVVRRDAYLAAGGFEADGSVGGEEQPLAAALADRGWELVYADDVRAQHRPSSHRDPAGRRAIETRNQLWFAWRRRAPGAALRATARELARARFDRRRWSGVLAAVRRAPAALRARRTVEPRLERELARL